MASAIKGIKVLEGIVDAAKAAKVSEMGLSLMKAGNINKYASKVGQTIRIADRNFTILLRNIAGEMRPALAGGDVASFIEVSNMDQIKLMAGKMSDGREKSKVLSGAEMLKKLQAFKGKKYAAKVAEIQEVWATKYPVEEMLQGRTFFEDVMGEYRYKKSDQWKHTADIASNFKGIDFYKGIEVVTEVDGKLYKNVTATTAVSMKTTIQTDVDIWLSNKTVRSNINTLVASKDLSNAGITWGNTNIKYANVELHIYMPKANITPELTTTWMNKLNADSPNVKFEIKALEDYIN